MAELLRRTDELPLSVQMFHVFEVDLVMHTAKAIPKGSYDLGATGSTDYPLLAKTENTPRMVGYEACRQVRMYDPREGPDALTHTSRTVRGAGETPYGLNLRPYRDCGHRRAD
ncbi:MAG: hypothetical protein OXH01_06420 [Bacteroidetes bacterium]|nr:hypothetical protein [Bacteroidota bacterium]